VIDILLTYFTVLHTVYCVLHSRRNAFILYSVNAHVAFIIQQCIALILERIASLNCGATIATWYTREQSMFGLARFGQL